VPLPAADERHRPERPAYYAARPGPWRDWWTLLHPPYTAWHLSYVVLGACLAPQVRLAPLLAALAAFFLAVGVAAHALDELHGRPLRTAIPAAVLIGAAVISLAGAVAIGVAGVARVGWPLVPFLLAGPVLVQAHSYLKQTHDLLAFFADRLKVTLRENGARHDLVDAVFALDGQDDLLLIVRRVEALGKFLDTDDGKNLLAGVKRASNILRIEEKKDNKTFAGAPDAKRLAQPEEKALAEAVNVAKKEASAAVVKEDFAAAMSALAKLRPKVDAFFDKVTVNVDDKALRENRLMLLNEIREATRAVADFSKIEG